MKLRSREAKSAKGFAAGTLAPGFRWLNAGLRRYSQYCLPLNTKHFAERAALIGAAWRMPCRRCGRDGVSSRGPSLNVSQAPARLRSVTGFHVAFEPSAEQVSMRDRYAQTRAPSV